MAMVPDGAGGMFIVWEDRGNAGALVQRFDGSGSPLWVNGGVAVAEAAGYQLSPMAVSDGAGGVIVVWVDGRNGSCGPSFMGECDVFAQRLNGAGQRLWQIEGVPIVTAPRNQGASGLAIASDGAGGAILAWEDARPPNCCKVFAQRVTSNGQTSWATDGIRISPEPSLVIGAMFGAPLIASDAAGGAIIAWMNNQELNSPPLIAQRVNGTGDPLWGPAGIAMGFPIRTPITMTADGNGGVVAAWPVQGQDGDELVAQRVNGSGQALWTANGVPFAAAQFAQSFPDIVSDGGGGAIVVWMDERNGAPGDCGRLVGNCDIYAQRLNAAGQALWQTNGIPVSNAANTQSTPRAVADGAAGAVVVWMDCSEMPDIDSCGYGLDLVGQHVSASAQLLWDAAGVPVSMALGNQGIAPGTPFFSSVALIPDGVGGAIVAWPDGRNTLCQQLTPDCDLFVQRMGEHRAQPDPIISVSPSSVDVGLTTIGSPVDGTFFVRNIGDGPLTGTASAGSPLGIVSGTPFNVPAGGSQAVLVRFSPSAEGPFVGGINFTSNGGNVVRSVEGDGTLQPTVGLTVGKAGSGTGMVTTTGINCGLDCTQRYLFMPPGGIVVNLFAASSPGSSFVGWSGGCSGTTLYCYLIMSENISVTAKFSRIYTDDPLTAQLTVMKAVHLTELQQSINTLRSRIGLGAVAFNAAVAGGLIRAVHISELRTALDAVYDALGRSRPTYTDAAIGAGTTIKAAHIMELRDAVRAVE